MSVKQRNVVIERGVRIVGSDGSSGKHPADVLRQMNDKRENEKHELQVLNQRFSSYVERVRALEAMNSKLLSDIDELKKKWGLDSGKIKEQMEPELHRQRELIDEITRLKAVSEIKAKRAESDALQFKHLMDLAMDSFNSDKNKILNLERLLDNTRQDTEYLRSQLHDLTEQLGKYLEEQRRLSEQLRQLKDDLDRETIERVARQNEVQTLEEQIAFLKAIHEQEVSELSRLQTIVGFDPAQFYRSELERAIRDIRGDFEQLNTEQKRELEEWYRIKTEEVERDVAKEREYQRVVTSGLSVEESANLKESHLQSQREFIDLQQRHAKLMSHLRELEERLEQTKSNNQVALAERDRDIALLREKISELMSTYDELMNRKTSLEFEINTYRRLLECEETRIKSGGGVSSVIPGATYSYSSSSSSSTVHSSASGSGLNYGRGTSPGPASVLTNLVRAADPSNDPQGGANRSSVTQRGGSTELSSETITKRMQVQRTSKGEDFY
jgi:chromosome segregation ATPase